MSNSPLNNVVVQFDLPFVLRLVDSIRGDSQPDGYEQYVFPIAGIPTMLRFEKKTRNLRGVHIATEDRRGLLSYSQVQVWVSPHFFERFPVEGNYRQRADELIDHALESVNRFVEAYRKVSGSFWLRPIRRREVPQFHLVARHQDGSEDRFITGTLGTGRSLGSLLPDEKDQRLRQLLNSEWRVDDVQRLAYMGTTLLDREDSWNSALVFAVLFEARFARLLRTAFQQRGLSDADMDAKFEYDNGRPRSVTNLLYTYVPELHGVDLDDQATELGEAVSSWKSAARDLRNEIAHGRVLNVSLAQAVEAAQAVKGLLAILEELFDSATSTYLPIPDTA